MFTGRDLQNMATSALAETGEGIVISSDIHDIQCTGIEYAYGV